MKHYIVSYEIKGEDRARVKEVFAQTARHAEIFVSAELAADKGGKIFKVRLKKAKPSKGNQV